MPHARRFQILLIATILAGTGCADQPPTNGLILPGPYTVVAEDNLTSIALRAYGDADLWKSLLNANRQLASRPRFRLEVGESINIPPKDKLDRSLPKSVFPKKLPADYIVMPGDSLPFIAQGCYGNRELWLQIYEANRSVLSKKVKDNPRLLIAGEVLRIPKPSPSSENAGGGE